MSNNIAKYEDAGKPLLPREQILVIASIDSCLALGIELSEVFERIRSFEADAAKRNLWHSARTDMQNGVPLHIALVKTGFFCSEVEAILLIVQNPEHALKTSIRFLNLVHN